MLPSMDQVTSGSPPIETGRRPSALADRPASEAAKADSTADASAAVAETGATFRGCPLLVAEHGGWRLDMPSRSHRCGAVSPPASLSPEKQARLCLTPAHTACATLQASVAARGARLGPVPANSDRATRWGLARTTAVIEEAGGLRSRVLGLLLDRGRWPAIPAVLLVVTLIVLAASGLRPSSPAAVDATASPVVSTHVPIKTAQPTSTPVESTPPEATTSPSPTIPPTARPSGTPKPSVSYTTYRVKSGDTLSAIASKFGTTSRAIADLNGFSVSTTLHIGQVLKIPTS